MQRLIATILLVVVLVPSVGPTALAYAVQPGTAHCLRKPLQGAQAAPAMPCHHGSAASTGPRSSETTFASLDSCCADHDCCRGLKTSEWARPVINPLFSHDLTIKDASRILYTSGPSTEPIRPGFARAPPEI